MKQKLIALFSILLIAYFLFPLKALAASPEATLTIDGGTSIIFSSVQEAVNHVQDPTTSGSDFVIEIATGVVTAPLDIIQQADKNLTIRPLTGADVTFTNTINIDGAGRHAGEERFLLERIRFDMTAGTISECVYFKLIGRTTGYCYPHNITINDCHIIGVEDDTVGVQSVGGGSYDIAITNCTADGMHSLAQLKAVNGYALIQNCVLKNSSGGVNFYGDADLIVDSCQFTVKGYAVRSGQNAVLSVLNVGSVIINNSILESSSSQDGVIVLRGGSSKYIRVVHSIITASNANGMALQNYLNPANAS